jgi:hypothetical protein
MSDPDTKDVNTHVPPPKPLLLTLIPLVLSAIALVLLLIGRCVPGAALALAAAVAGAWAVASFRSNPYTKEPARPIPVPVPPVRTAQAASMARSEPDTKEPLPHIPPPRPMMMPAAVVPLVAEATFDVSVAVTVAYSSCSAAAALSVLAVLAGIVAVVQQVRSRA